MDKPTFEADRFHLVLIDVASGKKRTVADTGTARSPTSAGRRTARPSWPTPMISASTACSHRRRQRQGDGADRQGFVGGFDVAATPW
jgi:hypothetical protein